MCDCTRRVHGVALRSCLPAFLPACDTRARLYARTHAHTLGNVPDVDAQQRDGVQTSPPHHLFRARLLPQLQVSPCFRWVSCFWVFCLCTSSSTASGGCCARVKSCLWLRAPLLPSQLAADLTAHPRHPRHIFAHPAACAHPVRKSFTHPDLAWQGRGRDRETDFPYEIIPMLTAPPPPTPSEPLNQTMDDDTPYKLDHDHLGISVLRHPFTRLASQYSFDRKKAKNKQFQQETIRTKGNKPFHECAAQDSCAKTNEFARWCSLQTRYTHALSLARAHMHARDVREQFGGGRLLRESCSLSLAVTADESS